MGDDIGGERERQRLAGEGTLEQGAEAVENRRANEQANEVNQHVLPHLLGNMLGARVGKGPIAIEDEVAGDGGRERERLADNRF